MTEAVERRAARILLRDERGAVLLLHGHDPQADDGRTWWFTPGGGVEEGESDEDAAVRELAEETGLTGIVPGPVVWRRDAEFTWNGVVLRQHEVFHAVRTSHFEPVADGWTELERRAQDGMRWWTPAELRATTETVFPEGLADLLASLDSA